MYAHPQLLCDESTRLAKEMASLKVAEHQRVGADWSDVDIGVSIVDLPPKSPSHRPRKGVLWTTPASCESTPGVESTTGMESSGHTSVLSARGTVMKIHVEYLDKLSVLYENTGSQSNRHGFCFCCYVLADFMLTLSVVRLNCYRAFCCFACWSPGA